MPMQDRPLSPDERNRMHAALLEVEQTIDRAPADLGGWVRVFTAQASRMAPPGASEIHLLRPQPVREGIDHRGHREPAGIHIEVTRRSWLDRLMDWWRP